MDEGTPHIEVRAVHVRDAPAIQNLDYNFETDRIYTLRVRERLLRGEQDEMNGGEKKVFAFELLETPINRPIYKDLSEDIHSVADVETRLRSAEGGYVALAGGELAGVVLLKVDEWRSVAQVQDLIVGHQFRRYGIGSLLLTCASDWARERGCWAIVLETQNINYPAIQFYLRNGLEVWGISRNFYPPGSAAHEVAIFMGKRLSSAPEE
ncbi:MAG: GNAT family N-acetyltransferase [Ktedonobacteraceae bacterium]|nr:GNAT family N-acetyltransferase [Ktedonobacteraceae bacterium]